METGDALEVFTTRPDTVWGATFMVLAPEHPLVAKITTPDRQADVDAYIDQARRQTEIERLSTDEARARTGVFTGGYAVNPVTDERIPVWIADYVLMGYGTGAIMAVPFGDQRDFEFARAFDLPIRAIVQPEDGPDARPGHDDRGLRRTRRAGQLRPDDWQAGARGAAARSSAGWRRPAAARRRSPTACATG